MTDIFNQLNAVSEFVLNVLLIINEIRKLRSGSRSG
ncbi:hypothetical protein EDF88_3953 [Buttiauxella sp. BIGb0552]|nr:hypothetical protein EDF88_3953 [Buttiauxella sp. BIGb0552]